MLIIFFAASVLLLVDTKTQWLKPMQLWITDAITPVYSLANSPDCVNQISGIFTSKISLENKIKLQDIELLVLRGRNQKMAELSYENLRLRNLLNASELLKNNVLVTELIGESSDPLSHTILVDRGENYGVLEGQAVLDSEGLMGQVIEVYQSSCKVLLISDSSNAVPVKISRNGIRFIAEGTGSYKNLSLRYVTSSADIALGDLLVSSGLGKRYPNGYPVGVITSKDEINGSPYLKVNIKPTANLDRSRHLLIVSQSSKKFGVDKGEK
jgi:rod shape-determining protein MreC